jgi:hypothetical protein
MRPFSLPAASRRVPILFLNPSMSPGKGASGSVVHNNTIPLRCICRAIIVGIVIVIRPERETPSTKKAMTRLRNPGLVFLLAGLMLTPLSPASAHRHHVPFFLWPFAAAAVVVGTAAAVATAPFAAVTAPAPAPYYAPPPAYYAPPPGAYGPPPGYYPPVPYYGR